MSIEKKIIYFEKPGSENTSDCLEVTANGADTVTVINSAASKRFLDLKVLEILAKPRA